MIHRVTSKTALASNTVISGCINSFKAGIRGELGGGSGASPGGRTVNSADGHITNPGEPGISVQTTDISSH